MYILKTPRVLLSAPSMHRQIQTTCFESAFIDNTLQTAGELEMNDWYTGNSEIILLLSQESWAMPQISPNWLNQYWLLACSTVLELL